MYDELDTAISFLENSYGKLGFAISSLGKPGTGTSDPPLELADISSCQGSSAPLKRESSEETDDDGQWEAPIKSWMSKRSVEPSEGDENLVSEGMRR